MRFIWTGQEEWVEGFVFSEKKVGGGGRGQGRGWTESAINKEKILYFKYGKMEGYYIGGQLMSCSHPALWRWKDLRMETLCAFLWREKD